LVESREDALGVELFAEADMGKVAVDGLGEVALEAVEVAHDEGDGVGRLVFEEKASFAPFDGLVDLAIVGVAEEQLAAYPGLIFGVVGSEIVSDR
jgi:hypothetical protein